MRRLGRSQRRKRLQRRERAVGLFGGLNRSSTSELSFLFPNDLKRRVTYRISSLTLAATLARGCFSLAAFGFT